MQRKGNGNSRVKTWMIIQYNFQRTNRVSCSTKASRRKGQKYNNNIV